MAAVTVFRAGSEEEPDIQLKVQGGSPAGQQGLMEAEGLGGQRLSSIPVSATSRVGVTLGLSLKVSGPSFHLKNGSDDTCVLAGIVTRIREIRKTHGAL